MDTNSKSMPAWAQALLVRLAPVGTRTVVQRGDKVYRYRYLRLDVRVFHEVIGARRIRLVVAPPDLSEPPVAISARLVKRGKYVQAFTIDATYQKVLERYIRNGYVGVLFMEIIEHEKPAEAPRL